MAYYFSSVFLSANAAIFCFLRLRAFSIWLTIAPINRSMTINILMFMLSFNAKLKRIIHPAYTQIIKVVWMCVNPKSKILWWI